MIINKGSIVEELLKFDEAILMYNEAIKLNINDANAYF